MKSHLAIGLCCLIAQVAMLPAEDEYEAEYSNSIPPPPQLGELPIAVPASVLVLLERLNEAAKEGLVNQSNIDEFLQQQHTPQQLEQLLLVAAQVNEQVNDTIQESFARIAQALQVLEQRQPQQSDILELLQQLSARVARLQQLQLQLRTEAAAANQQQDETNINGQWVEWLEQLQRDMAGQNNQDDDEVQRILQLHLQELRNCENDLRYRLQEYELSVWEGIEGPGDVLEQKSIRCSKSEAADDCTFNVEDFRSVLEQFDVLIAQGEEWLSVIQRGDAYCYQQVLSKLEWAGEVLTPEVVQALAAASDEL